MNNENVVCHTLVSRIREVKNIEFYTPADAEQKIYYKGNTFLKCNPPLIITGSMLDKDNACARQKDWWVPGYDAIRELSVFCLAYRSKDNLQFTALYGMLS